MAIEARGAVFAKKNAKILAKLKELE